ncbi:translation initiation factor eIF-2B subunit gamma-like [Uranotaenia lowii]|uniref:translation initiation factor eIF-2B subunit gamma-like n=1 Tax=Uranotaenia lowii TaxID=190385 RepID=UPI00247AB20F|nr:translation initiation factor eIF-2B subunit gamma-like [Uranotaenia lowii]XP_055589219.1 translation initiation factor eIF-2B subunit gamma-like [Uranotaenia lowii]
MGLLEFQAVVLAAGKGSRFPELLEGRPKCLLPIGTYPLIWYPLRMLQRHGFQDAIVIVLEHEKSEIQQRIEKTQLKMKLEFFTITGDSDIGTADSLRMVADRIKSDVVVVSSDTIVELSLYPLLKQFREQRASFVSLLVQNGGLQKVTVPGPKMKHKLERDLFGINSQNNRLLFMGSESDFEENFTISGHLLRLNEEMDIRSGLLDTHIYVISKWVFDYLEASTDISTLKGELLPLIVKKQMSSSSKVQASTEKPTSEHNVNFEARNIHHYVPNTEMDRKITSSSIFNQGSDLLANNRIRCYVVIAPENSFGTRVNTMASYWRANQQVMKFFPSVTDLPVTALNGTNSDIKSNQLMESAIGEQAKICEKTSISGSIIGSHCTVNPKSRLINCTLMDHVSIGENVILENCIVGEKTIVESGVTLKNCLIGSNYTVTTGSKKENQHLSNAERFMEI